MKASKIILLMLLAVAISSAKNSDGLADVVDDETFCVCYFGGDPSTQVVHAINASKIILRKRNDVPAR